MQAIMKLMSVPRVMIDTNAQVNKNHFTNKVGLILEYDGKQGVAPIIHNGASMPPELMAQLEFLIAQGYARVGLTPMDTQGQQKTGSGNTSGEALKTMTDIKSTAVAAASVALKLDTHLLQTETGLIPLIQQDIKRIETERSKEKRMDKIDIFDQLNRGNAPYKDISDRRIKNTGRPGFEFVKKRRS